MAPSPDALVDSTVAASPLAGKYATATDRESAFEKLSAEQAQTEQANAEAPPAAETPSAPAPAPPAPRARPAKEEPGMVEQVVQSSAFKSMLRSAGTVLGREITRSIFGTSRRR